MQIRWIRSRILLFIIASAAFNYASGDDVMSSEGIPPTIVAHYMTWYQTPEFSGDWGFWQINRPGIDPMYRHYPEQRRANGWRDISSVYYPLPGPYDSADPDLCEYQILLARLAGIDAFVCDWYGFKSFPEHPYDNLGFGALLERSEAMGFKVALCIEDRGFFVEAQNRAEAIRAGREILRRAEEAYFQSPAYLKLEGRPVIMNFAWGEPGPSVQEPWLFPHEWDDVLGDCRVRPLFVHDYQAHHRTYFLEAYDSTAPWGSCLHGRSDCPEFWERANAKLGEGRFHFLSATVAPGFDNRGSGGWGEHVVTHSRRGGEAYRETWESALRHRARFIQIATWNDFNEGATIEPVRHGILHADFPSDGYGYRELETTQSYANKMKSVPYTPGALRIPVQLYACRKMVRACETMAVPIDGALLNSTMDRAAQSLLSNREEEARQLVNAVYTSLPSTVLQAYPELAGESIFPNGGFRHGGADHPGESRRSAGPR